MTNGYQADLEKLMRRWHTVFASELEGIELGGREKGTRNTR